MVWKAKTGWPSRFTSLPNSLHNFRLVCVPLGCEGQCNGLIWVCFTILSDCFLLFFVQYSKQVWFYFSTLYCYSWEISACWLKIKQLKVVCLQRWPFPALPQLDPFKSMAFLLNCINYNIKNLRSVLCQSYYLLKNA